MTMREIPCRVFWILSLGAVLLMVMHCVVNFLNSPGESILLDAFDLGAEHNIPTWFSSILWFITGLTAYFCFVVEQTNKLTRGAWLAAALVFGLFSLDEVAEIHEVVGTYVQEGSVLSSQSFSSPGSPWITVYGPLLLTGGLLLILFFLKTLATSKLRIGALTAIGLLVVAIAMDYFQGMPDPLRTSIASNVMIEKNFAVECSMIVEEFSEMLASIILSTVFLSHAVRSSSPEPTSSATG